MDVKLFNQPSDQLDEELLREGPDLRVPRCRQGEDVLDGFRRHCFLIFLDKINISEFKGTSFHSIQTVG